MSSLPMYPLLMASMLATSPTGDSQGCAIVDGSDWAIISQAPEGWQAACGADAMDGTAITMWPVEKASGKSTMIYVTVSGKEKDSLESFVTNEITQYKAHNEHPDELVIERQPDVSPSRRLVHFGDPAAGRDELVEYIEGDTAFFIVVLTTDSQSATKHYQPAFESYLDGFSPANVTRESK